MIEPYRAEEPFDFEGAARLSSRILSLLMGVDGTVLYTLMASSAMAQDLNDLPPAQDAYVGTYITVDEYADWDALPKGINSPEDLAAHIIASCDFEKLMWSLARMNHFASKLAKPPGLVEGYRQSLPESWKEPFNRALHGKTGGLGRFIAARQPLLAAMRAVLTTPLEGLCGTGLATLSDAVRLSHAVAVRLERAL